MYIITIARPINVIFLIMDEYEKVKFITLSTLHKYISLFFLSTKEDIFNTVLGKSL
jgi:hypothetical protein